MLEFNDQKSTSGSGAENNLGDNIYYNEGTILSVKDVTDTADNAFENDIAIQLMVQVPNLNDPKTITISGDFKRDQMTKEVVDWGGAFKIQKLCQACGLDGTLNAHYKLDAGILQQMVGKTIVFANYKKKDGKYKPWNQVFNPADLKDKNDLKVRFLNYQKYLKNNGIGVGASWAYDPGSSLPDNSTSVTNTAGDPWKKEQAPTPNGSPMPSFMK